MTRDYLVFVFGTNIDNESLSTLTSDSVISRIDFVKVLIEQIVGIVASFMSNYCITYRVIITVRVVKLGRQLVDIWHVKRY